MKEFCDCLKHFLKFYRNFRENLGKNLENFGNNFGAPKLAKLLKTKSKNQWKPANF